MSWLHPEAFWLLPVMIVPASLWFLQHLRSQNAHRLFGLAPPTGTLTRTILLTLAAGGLVVAVAGPVTQLRTVKTPGLGRDLVVVVDVSRSMLTPDLTPNRLERAKLGLHDLVPSLDGDRVALFAFAGTTVLKVPLTTDYSYFLAAVDELGVQSAARGGSMIGDALRKVQDTVLAASSTGATVLLITDGGDQDSFPVEAARRLAEGGARLIILGLGNTEGSPIILPDGQRLKYNGEEVLSGLNVKLLQDMAQATPGGVFLPAGTNPFDLGSLYRQLRSGLGQVQSDRETKQYTELYAVPGAVAGLLLLAAVGLPYRRRAVPR